MLATSTALICPVQDALARTAQRHPASPPPPCHADPSLLQHPAVVPSLCCTIGTPLQLAVPEDALPSPPAAPSSATPPSRAAEVSALENLLTCIDDGGSLYHCGVEVSGELGGSSGVHFIAVIRCAATD